MLKLKAKIILELEARQSLCFWCGVNSRDLNERKDSYVHVLVRSSTRVPPGKMMSLNVLQGASGEGRMGYGRRTGEWGGRMAETIRRMEGTFSRFCDDVNMKLDRQDSEMQLQVNGLKQMVRQQSFQTYVPQVSGQTSSH